MRLMLLDKIAATSLDILIWREVNIIPLPPTTTLFLLLFLHFASFFVLVECESNLEYGLPFNDKWIC